MSAISYAINELFHVIDRNLLEQAYVYNGGQQAACPFAQLENMIIDTTLFGRVMADINLIGGMQKHLCTAHGQIVHQDGWGTVFHYPDDGLHGHSIMTATAFFPGMTCMDGVSPNMPCSMAGYPFLNANFGATGSMQHGMAGLAHRLARTNVHGPQAIVTPRVVAHNSIMLDHQRIPNMAGSFVVILSHDEALNDLSPRTWPFFSQLVTAAVRAYIYQVMRSKIMRGALYQGQEYNIFTEMVMEFAQAEEEYRVLRQTWGRVAFTNDRNRYNSFIRLQTRAF